MWDTGNKRVSVHLHYSATMHLPHRSSYSWQSLDYTDDVPCWWRIEITLRWQGSLIARGKCNCNLCLGIKWPALAFCGVFLNNSATEPRKSDSFPEKVEVTPCITAAFCWKAVKHSCKWIDRRVPFPFATENFVSRAVFPLQPKGNLPEVEEGGEEM